MFKKWTSIDFKRERPTWEVVKLSQSCTSRAVFLNEFVGLEFTRLHVNYLDRFAVSHLGKPRLGPFGQNFSTPLRHRQSNHQKPSANKPTN